MSVRIFYSRFWVAVLLALLLTGCDNNDANTAAPATAASNTTSAGNSKKEIVQRELKRPVDSETLPYADVDENLVYGYFAFPSDMIEPLPAIILIHDWWGLNEDTRASADQLASEGYMVLAIDLYSGKTYESADEARVQTISVLEKQDAVVENIRQALEFLDAADAPLVGTAGWGFGGSWSLNAAVLFPGQVAASAVMYGQMITDQERLRPINAPILALFGANDRAVPVATTEAFSEAMQLLRKPADVHVYPGAGHAFADPRRSGYDQKIADDAWTRLLTFFAENLSVPEQS
jgi:carboxymethylenebutenolidase